MSLLLILYSSRLPIDEDDAGLLFEDIHRGRSVIPPHAVPSRPALVRWDPNLPLTLDNCVSMDFAEAEKHVKECFGEGERKRPEEVWGKETAEVVERRAAEVKKVQEWVL